MRRPSPLPQTATARPAVRAAVDDTRAAQADADEPERIAAEPVVSPADALLEADAAQTAPIIPITGPIAAHTGRPTPLPGQDPQADDEDASPDESTDAAPVGMRDVWRAARARRRALRAEVRRFTVRQRRRRTLWIGIGAAVVVLVLATLGAAYSPLFAVERINVVGTEALDAAAVEAALADQLGTPLPLVDDSEVKAALVTFPLVESYSLEAWPPHELVVRIVERTPIGYIESAAGFTLVDAAGVALTTAAAPGSDAPLLTITGGLDSAAFEAAGQVMRSLPDAIRAQVTAVSASTPDDVAFDLASGAHVVWGSADDSAMKAIVLETTMTARPPGSRTVYDVSSPSAVVVR